MNFKSVSMLAVAAVMLCGSSRASAAFVQWYIDSSVSKISIAIPDQVVNLNGTVATVRVRNETGSSNTWNQGNSAAIGGFLNSFYTEGGSHNIQFLANPVGQVYALNSGNYRPNPARYSTAVTDTANPDGTFTGSSASDFAAAFAAKVRASVSILTVDLLYLDFFNTFLDVNSPAMPVSGVSAGTFSPGGVLQAGIINSGIGVDGVNALIVGQVVPDTLDTFGPTLGTAASGTGAISTLGPDYRTLDLSFTIPVAADLGGAALNMIFNGTIHATITPEPSTLMMAGVGLISLAAIARRRRRPLHA